MSSRKKGFGAKMQRIRISIAICGFFVLVFHAEAAESLELSRNVWDTAQHLSFNLMKADNIQTHNTKLFRHQPGLHVRHGLDFRLALQRHQPCDKDFTFKLIESDTDPVFTWSQKPLVQDGVHHFNLHVNRSIPVGKYSLNVSDPCAEKGEFVSGKSVQLCDVYVMFNPQSEGKHLEVGTKHRRQTTSDIQKEEYIENNCGYIWIGNGAIPWNYAVGSQAVTDSTKALMQMMSQAERSDKVLYSRALSRLVGNEVVRGRWDGHYSDGMDPTQWIGSEAILSRWLRRRAPVRYGQCWVFAAVLTTVLRASGIPARSVTNYASHHDRGLTDDQTAVLRQYDNIVQDDESTWNFHVWSEAWLERPDLGQPSEWNAVDATPQEPSPLAPGNPYRAGPAYVPYIRMDRRNENYDNYFILAEANAQKRCPKTGKLLPSAVGTSIVTKKPGMDRQVYKKGNPNVITNDYKIPSTSKRAPEIDAFILPRPYVGCEREEGMRLDVSSLNPMVGENFTLTVTGGNVSVEDTVIRMELMNYMGESLGNIDTFTGVTERVVTEADYLRYLGNSSVFRFTLGTINQSDVFEFHDDLRIRLEYDDILVETTRAPNSTIVTLTITYTNPLSIPMTGVVLSVASPDNTYLRLEQPDIPARSPFTTTVEVECGVDDEGDAIIPVSLDSDETQSAYGMGWISCRDAEPSNGGGTTVPWMSGLQMALLSLAVLFSFV